MHGFVGSVVTRADDQDAFDPQFGAERVLQLCDKAGRTLQSGPELRRRAADGIARRGARLLRAARWRATWRRDLRARGEAGLTAFSFSTVERCGETASTSMPVARGQRSAPLQPCQFGGAAAASLSELDASLESLRLWTAVPSAVDRSLPRRVCAEVSKPTRSRRSRSADAHGARGSLSLGRASSPRTAAPRLSPFPPPCSKIPSHAPWQPPPHT